jgi:hypothetical protein
MEIVELVAEDDKVVGWFTCSATHLGDWLGHAPTGRRFERVDEVAIFRLRHGRIVRTWSLEVPGAAAPARAHRLDRLPSTVGAAPELPQDRCRLSG